MNDSVEPTAPATTGAAPLAEAAGRIDLLRREIGKALVGQDEVVRDVVVTLLSAGHVLLEGVPGLGKTLLVRALARCIDARFSRIQFTPDLMPSDVTGHAVYDMQKGVFEVRKGPAFTNLLLADEINRAPAKTQAALLEVMQERQITVEGESFGMDAPFMVLATQNPVEQDGTYPLPEAELDRFLLKVLMDFPESANELALVQRVTDGRIGDILAVDDLHVVLDGADVVRLQELVAQLPVDEQVLDYAIRLVRATRDTAGIARGAGPRGSIALVRAARAHALVVGNDFTTPDDVKTMALPVLRHRIQISAELEIEGVRPDQVLTDLLGRVEAPRR